MLVLVLLCYVLLLLLLYVLEVRVTCYVRVTVFTLLAVLSNCYVRASATTTTTTTTFSAANVYYFISQSGSLYMCETRSLLLSVGRRLAPTSYYRLLLLLLTSI